jgi:primosomal protein N' (replication factor Y) (superfamily II helicase)
MNLQASLFTEEKTKLVDVAIPLPINDPFTYQVPKHLEHHVQLGSRVLVPFKNRTITGYVVDSNSNRPVNRPKKVLEVLGDEPIIESHHIELARMISQHYFSSWGEAISNMVPKHFKNPKQKQVKDLLIASTTQTHIKEIQLTLEQSAAVGAVINAMEKEVYSEFFLFGVTGAGKSEVYIRLIKDALRRSGSTICLVPEIAITEQLKHFFLLHFNQELEILHSKLTDRNRFDAWKRIRKGEKKVVLGARSAIFAPVQNLKLIIMDEEQEGSYKQDQSPRYHAREVARWRAQLLKVPFLMGTATPTLETMQQTVEGGTQLLHLSKRIDNRPLPQVRVIDLKQMNEQHRKSTILSRPLTEALRKTLELKNGALILLNRRGFSTHLRCAKCQISFFCPLCAVPLTFHQENQELLCHYCNHHEQVPNKCYKCDQRLIKFSGFGTEKVESELSREFLQARIARLDADTTKKRGSHERIISDFRAKKIDILVGTQMIAKGFDFHHVALVGVINADIGLMLPDFRAGEKTFQLLTQMAGRTGRGKDVGQVIVQTYSPNHYAIDHASRHDYNEFFKEEIGRRKELAYPPFSRIINILIRGKNERNVEEEARQLRELIGEYVDTSQIQLLGPAPLPFYRLRGHFRWHVMMKASPQVDLAQPLRNALKKLKRKTGVFVAVDVDPTTIL